MVSTCPPLQVTPTHRQGSAGALHTSVAPVVDSANATSAAHSSWGMEVTPAQSGSGTTANDTSAVAWRGEAWVSVTVTSKVWEPRSRTRPESSPEPGSSDNSAGSPVAVHVYGGTPPEAEKEATKLRPRNADRSVGSMVSGAIGSSPSPGSSGGSGSSGSDGSGMSGSDGTGVSGSSGVSVRSSSPAANARYRNAAICPRVTTSSTQNR